MSRLLQSNEARPAEIVNVSGYARFVVVCEHAGRQIPRLLEKLGISDDDRKRHIAWDIGAWEIAKRVSTRLGAPLIGQRYSRLVCDCNRSPDADDVIPQWSDGTFIPGNDGLSASSRMARIEEIHEAFHREVTKLLDDHARRVRDLALISIHSFTPKLNGKKRPWHVGILHPSSGSLQSSFLSAFRSDPEIVAGDNEPYSLLEDDSFTLGRHGIGRGIDCIEIEIRQDLIEGPSGQQAWAHRICDVIERMERDLRPTSESA